jgi:chromosome segregation protein
MTFSISRQHYFLSGFSAFDEVDIFLDGSNAERLARMIKQ